MRILLVGFACSPDHGSEQAITWSWAWSLSQQCEVWVITHPEYRQNIEDYLAKHPNPNLHFCFVQLAGWMNPWDTHHLGKLRLHYLFWQQEAYRVARKLHQEIVFDLVHYVSWATISSAPQFWRLPVPFVWGPVGGGQVAPTAFRRYFGARWRSEFLRTLRVKLLPWIPAIRKAVQQSALILTINPETVEVLRLAGAKRMEMFNIIGIVDEHIPKVFPKREPKEYLTLLWASRFEPRKGLPLLLEALERLRDLPLRVLVAGDGPLRGLWETEVVRLNLADTVRFLGMMNWHQMRELYHEADIFVFTSLQDTFGNVTLEALAQGLPVLTLGHQGVGYQLPDAATLKVPVTTPDEVVARLAEGIRKLHADPRLRYEMGKAGWEYVKSNSQSVRADRMVQLYRRILASRENPSVKKLPTR